MRSWKEDKHKFEAWREEQFNGIFGHLCHVSVTCSTKRISIQGSGETYDDAWNTALKLHKKMGSNWPEIQRRLGL